MAMPSELQPSCRHTSGTGIHLADHPCRASGKTGHRKDADTNANSDIDAN